MDNIKELTEELNDIKADIKVEEKMIEKKREELLKLCQTKSIRKAEKIIEKVNSSLISLDFTFKELTAKATDLINGIKNEL